jgi:hypothetical protein
MLKTKISLKSFFIFNSTFCNREGEVSGVHIFGWNSQLNSTCRRRTKFCSSIRAWIKMKS